MKTIEEKSDEYVAPIVEEHAECRWCDAGELEEMLKKAFEAGARAVQEWISVDDELPEPFEEVLVKIGSEIAIAYISDNGEYEWYLQGESALRGYAIEPDFWRPIECK